MVYILRLILWNGLIWILKEGWWHVKLLNTDTSENDNAETLFLPCEHQTTHTWKFLQSKHCRTDFLKVFCSRCLVHCVSVPTAALQWRYPEERVGPCLRCLFSMGQLLCVVMAMIDCNKPVNQTFSKAI